MKERKEATINIHLVFLTLLVASLVDCVFAFLGSGFSLAAGLGADALLLLLPAAGAGAFLLLSTSDDFGTVRIHRSCEHSDCSTK